MSNYKRGVITTSGGRHYGRLPDGTLYRIYPTADRPFLQIVDASGQTFLRVRQATERGFTDCPPRGAVDLSYPESELRRARTVGGGFLCNALTCGATLATFVEWT